MSDETSTPARVRWATLRLSVIGTLLSSPPESGELGAAIAALAARMWRHPTTGEAQHFSAKTIERWFYAAKGEQEPIVALERKVPSHAGTHPSVTPAVAEVIRTGKLQPGAPMPGTRTLAKALVISRNAAIAWTYSASVTGTSGWKPDALGLIRGRDTVTSVRQ